MSDDYEVHMPVFPYIFIYKGRLALPLIPNLSVNEADEYRFCTSLNELKSIHFAKEGMRKNAVHTSFLRNFFYQVVHI